MSKEQHPMTIEPDKTNALVAWLQDIVRQGRLAWRLFWDGRVPWLTKLIPPLVLAYVLSPIDLIPDVAFGLGQLDDIAVLLIGVKLFIELAPPDIVREHLRALGARITEWRVVEGESGPPAVVEGEYEVKEPEAPETEEFEAEEVQHTCCCWGCWAFSLSIMAPNIATQGGITWKLVLVHYVRPHYTYTTLSPPQICHILPFCFSFLTAESELC